MRWVQEAEEEFGIAGCSPFSVGRGPSPAELSLALLHLWGGNGDDVSVGEQSGLKSWVHRGHRSFAHSRDIRGLLGANTMGTRCWGRPPCAWRRLLLCSGASAGPLEKQSHPVRNEPPGALLHAPALLPGLGEKEPSPPVAAAPVAPLQENTPSGRCTTQANYFWHF